MMSRPTRRRPNPDDLRLEVRRLTRLIVASGRVAGIDEVSIRAAVAGSIKMAIIASGDEIRRTGAGSMADQYRTVLDRNGMDRHDQQAQEGVYHVAIAAVAEALAVPWQPGDPVPPGTPPWPGSTETGREIIHFRNLAGRDEVFDRSAVPPTDRVPGVIDGKAVVLDEGPPARLLLEFVRLASEGRWVIGTTVITKGAKTAEVGYGEMRPMDALRMVLDLASGWKAPPIEFGEPKPLPANPTLLAEMMGEIARTAAGLKKEDSLHVMLTEERVRVGRALEGCESVEEEERVMADLRTIHGRLKVAQGERVVDLELLKPHFNHAEHVALMRAQDGVELHDKLRQLGERWGFTAAQVLEACPPTAADRWTYAMVQALDRLKGEIAARLEDGPAEVASPQTQSPVEPAAAMDLIRLDQAAAIVGRSGKTLRRHFGRNPNPFPDPVIEGGRGKPALWSWAEVRPWLAREYGRNLPEKFPGMGSR